MLRSQNGWPVISGYDSPQLHTWLIPAKNGTIKLTLRYGSAGFLLAHFAMWWDATIEDLSGKVVDDWGYAPRNIRGSDTTSNHASGTAADLNATQHPLGKRGTLTRAERVKVAARLKFYNGVLRHGAFYSGRVDEMHVEINKPLASAERLARFLMKFGRGKKLIEANPGQRQVILS